LSNKFCSKQISAAPTVDELFLQGSKIQIDLAAQQRVKAFEGGHIDVGGMNGRECHQIRPDRPAKADAREIIIQSKFIRHVMLPKCWPRVELN
jgi:hypothetical protein